MNWPGAGDKYYTAEGGTRRTYYGISAIPEVFIANRSAYTGSSTTFTNTVNTNYAIAAKATIVSNYWLTGTSPANGKIKVTTTVTPTVTMTGVNLFISLNEKVTTGNVGTNGETSFHHVMMKMVPNATGRALTLTAGTPVTVTDSALLTGTHIERMTDLEVAVWAQNVSTHEVLQSAWATVGTGINDNSRRIAASKAMVVMYNPGQKTVIVSNARGAVIAFHDLSGKQIARFASNQNSITIPAGALGRGCRIVQMVKNGEHVSQMITITE